MRGGRWWLLTPVAALVLLVGWTAWSGYQAYRHLSEARSSIDAARDDLDRSDMAAARRSLDAGAEDLRSAAGALDQLPWRLWQHLPIVGDDIRAARTVADVGRDLSAEALPELLDAYDQVQRGDLRRRDGSLVPARITALAGPLDQVSADLESGVERLDALDADGVDPRLGRRIEEIRTALRDSLEASRDAASTVGILGPMLEGRHSYVVLFHNVAELTSNGGLPGAWTQLLVDDGRIRVGRQGAGNDVVSGQRVAPVAPELVDAFGIFVDRDLRNADVIPDYPTAAQAQQVLLERIAGVKVDGVIGIDPVAIAALLEATGPVAVGDGIELDASNAADFLVNGVYSEVPDTTEQDALFARVVRVVFDRVRGADLPLLTLARSVADGVDQGRIRLWSADVDLQRRIAASEVGHALPADGERAMGMYLIDTTLGKMSYYLDIRQRTTATSCSADGRQRYRTQVVLRSTAPADAASTLPEYVLGPGAERPGSIRISVVLLGPAGGTTPTFSIVGNPLQTRTFEIFGRPAAQATLLIAPGEVYPVDIETSGPPGQRADLEFAMTPTIRAVAPQSSVASACE